MGTAASERAENRRRHRLRLYVPHAKQLELHESRARYRVGVWGRQAGKSTWGNNELLAKAWTAPGVYWFVSPTIDQAKVQFRRALMSLPPRAVYDYNQSERSISLISGGVVRYKSGHIIENLLGETLHGVVIDELREQHPDLWQLIIRPMLTTTKGWAAFISSPNGFDQLYDFWQRVQRDRTGRWFGIQAPSTCNPLWDQQEYDDAKAELSEPQFAQEILAEFRDLTTGRAYFNYGQHNHSINSPFAPAHIKTDFVPFLPILVGADFNLNPMAWTLGQHLRDRIHYAKEIHLPRSNTPEAAKTLVTMLRDIEKDVRLDLEKTGILVIGDATGKAGQRTSNKSDYDVLFQELKKEKIHYRDMTPDSNPGVRDRVTTANARFKSGDDKTYVTVNPVGCPKLDEDLIRVVWKDSAGTVLDEGPKKERTHQSDSATYPIAELLPIKLTKPGTLRVIQR